MATDVDIFTEEKFKAMLRMDEEFRRLENESASPLRIVAVSGGFDPVHIGHVRMIRAAKKLHPNTIVIVILNNDNWVFTKKGYVFMHEQDRKEIMESIRGVHKVFITRHKKNDPDRSVCEMLRELKPHVFANGGDRFADNTPEVAVCSELGIEMVFNVGGEKIASSSELVGALKEK